MQEKDNASDEKDIGVICNWYQLNSDRSLTYLHISCPGFYNLKNYTFSITTPLVCDGKYFVQNDVYNQMKSFFYFSVHQLDFKDF